MIVLRDPEPYGNPKFLGETHAPAHSEPPPGHEKTDEPKPKKKILNATHWVKGNSRIGLEGQEKCGELKALREQYPPAHLKLPQYREETERKEVGEAPEGVKRANALRNKEYLGMVKKERQVIRELLEDKERERTRCTASREPQYETNPTMWEMRRCGERWN